MKHTVIVTAAALTLAIGFTSCSPAAGPGAMAPGARTESTSTPTSTPGPWSVEGNGILFPTADFEPALSTEELARGAEMVVLGRVAGVVDGPLVGKAGDDFSDIRLVVLEIAIEEFAQGAPLPASDGTLYLRIPFPAGADVFRETIPDGSAVVVYANEIDETAEGSEAFEIVGGDRGAPSDQRLFAISSPQGLVFDTSTAGEGHLFWPFTVVRSEAPIARALPGGDQIGYVPAPTPAPDEKD